MTAPDTNVKKETRRHRPALWGMAAAAVFVVVLIATLGARTAENGDIVNENSVIGAASVDQTDAQAGTQTTVGTDY